MFALQLYDETQTMENRPWCSKNVIVMDLFVIKFYSYSVFSEFLYI